MNKNKKLNKWQWRILTSALIFSMVSTACGIKLPSLVTEIKTGPTQTMDIQVPLPADSTSNVELNLEFMAGELRLSPGDSGYLASVRATYNAAELEPVVEVTGGATYLKTGDLEIEGLPKFEDELKNEWDVQLGDTPMSLNIQAGAYSGNLELGGLSLNELTISEGGSDVTCSFSAPNHVEMSTFTYSTGGSTMELKGLSNANFETMSFNGGAGDYTLSFDGDLQRVAVVNIDAGVSTVNIIVPAGIQAQVIFDGGLTGVNAEGGWAQDGSTYTHAGSSPSLTIKVSMGMGTLNLKSG